MPKTANEVFRDNKRFTGDGLPGEPVNAPLPYGDPASGVHNPSKADIRDALGGVYEAAEIAKDAVDIATDLVADVQGATLFAGSLRTLLLNSSSDYPDGTIFVTRLEGSAYEVVSSDPDLTTAGGVMLRVVPIRGRVTPQMFGAVADAVWDAGAFAPLALPGGYTGTDATAMIQAAINAASSRSLTLHFPSGKYLIARQAAADKGIFTIPTQGIHITADQDAELWVDFNPNATYGVLDLFRTVGTVGAGRDAHGPVTIDGLTFRSLWSQYPSGGGNGGKVHILNIYNHRSVTLRGVRAFDICGKFSRSRMLGAVRVDDCHLERVASDGFRFIDCTDVRVTNNVLRHVDDDCIALLTNGGLPLRDNIVVTGNQITDCEGILVLGARNAIVSGNTLKRCKSNPIYVGGRVGQEGDHASLNISVTDNEVLDPLTRYDGASLMARTSVQCGIIAGGAVTSALSTGVDVGAASGGVVQPYAAVDNNGTIIAYAFDADVRTVPPAVNITVSGNSVLRTLPNVAAYANWGFGEMFYNSGWVNPAVTEDNRLTNGVGLLGVTWGAVVSGNIIRGCKSGAAVFLNATPAPDKNWAFRNVLISGNVGVDCQWGVGHSQYLANPAAPHPWGLVMDGNIFDLDPECANVSRASSGAWTVSTAETTGPCAYMLRNITGNIVSGGAVSNAYTVIVTNGSEISDYCDIRGVTVYCDPTAPGLNAGNKGVAKPEAGSRFRHVIAGCDPTQPDWRLVKNHCRVVSDDVPTTGKYVAGHIVYRRLPAYDSGSSSVVTGWVRLTTGSSHTVASNGDWWPIRSKA